MTFIRRHLLAVMATLAVFTVAAPISSASALTWPAGFSGAWPVGLTAPAVGGQAGSFGCGSNAPAGNGTAGGTTVQSCGGVLSFIGPSIGQIATAVGPTVIGATVLAPITVSTGPVQG